MTKALTLHQPWASLIAAGAKTIETRSWPTKHRGRLLIHAGTHRPPLMHLPPLKRDGTFEEQDAFNGQTWFVIDTITAPEHQRPHISDPDHPMRDHVPKWAKSPTLFWPHAGPHADVNDETGHSRTMVLPLGAVVASCTLADCVPIVHNIDQYEVTSPMIEAVPDGPLRLWMPAGAGTNLEAQRPFGDFAPGRYAWLLEDVKPTTERCPACWGECDEHSRIWRQVDVGTPIERRVGRYCPGCRGAGKCDPVPARGRQGLWNWEP